MQPVILESISFLDKLVNLLPFTIHGWGWALSIIAILVLVNQVLLRKWDIWNQLREGNMAVAIVIAAFIAGMFFLAGSAQGATSDYDRHFRKAARLYWSSQLEWYYFKGQGMAESRLKPYVCSGAGACGCMQFMPATARQFGINPLHCKASIYAAVDYDRRLWNQFTAPRPPWDRLAFALMSYNAGLGNVLLFQRAAIAAGVDPNLFETIKPFAWREPRDYVERIERWCRRFKRGPCSIG